MHLLGVVLSIRSLTKLNNFQEKNKVKRICTVCIPSCDSSKVSVLSTKKHDQLKLGDNLLKNNPKL